MLPQYVFLTNIDMRCVIDLSVMLACVERVGTDDVTSAGK